MAKVPFSGWRSPCHSRCCGEVAGPFTPATHKRAVSPCARYTRARRSRASPAGPDLSLRGLTVRADRADENRKGKVRSRGGGDGGGGGGGGGGGRASERASERVSESPSLPLSLSLSPCYSRTPLFRERFHGTFASHSSHGETPVRPAAAERECAPATRVLVFSRLNVSRLGERADRRQIAWSTHHRTRSKTPGSPAQGRNAHGGRLR